MGGGGGGGGRTTHGAPESTRLEKQPRFRAAGLRGEVGGEIEQHTGHQNLTRLAATISCPDGVVAGRGGVRTTHGPPEFVCSTRLAATTAFPGRGGDKGGRQNNRRGCRIHFFMIAETIPSGDWLGRVGVGGVGRKRAVRGGGGRVEHHTRGTTIFFSTRLATTTSCPGDMGCGGGG